MADRVRGEVRAAEAARLCIGKKTAGFSVQRTKGS